MNETILGKLEAIILDRRNADAGSSYVASLLPRVCQKSRKR